LFTSKLFSLRRKLYNVRPVRGTAQVTSNEGLLVEDEVKIYAP